MLMVRFWGAVIAVFVSADAFLSRDGSLRVLLVLLPAAAGAVAMLALCWREARTQRQRQLLAAVSAFLAAGLALSLVGAVVLAASPQPLVLACLFAGAVPLALRAFWLSRRRPRVRGFGNYYSH